MSKFLIEEPPLQVLPTLACQVGLNEAIVLQQFKYWLDRSNNIEDGHKWIYNSYQEWNKQFPFWGKNTLVRAINNLEKEGLLVSGNFNKAKFDKTKWYRINYDRLDELEGLGKRSTQNGLTRNPKWVNGETQNGLTNTNRLPETTTEITKRKIKESSGDLSDGTSSAPVPYSEIIDYLNEKTGKNYKSKSRNNQKLIKARWNEGYTVDDFKKVIDNKVADWKDDSKMNKYLQPSTLFRASKFEGYLNEKPKQKASQGSWDDYYKTNNWEDVW